MSDMFCDVCYYLANQGLGYCTDHNGHNPSYNNGYRPIDHTLLEEAGYLVSADRQQTYGHPAKNFAETAALWSVVLGIPVAPEQVALCMVQVKIAREINLHKRDNIVDAIGYLVAYDAARP
jgi:hypothetical protein